MWVANPRIARYTAGWTTRARKTRGQRCVPVHSIERVRSLVSFRSQFSASQDKAHNRNIATKIHEEMTKLRAGMDASPTTPRRWVWELIQNAKDVNIDGKVRVRIEADLDGTDAHVTFKHNGGAFSPENIRFLIEQVSSKDRTNDSDGRPTTTGKFGTGFLTTHLLSERVVVKSVAEGRRSCKRYSGKPTFLRRAFTRGSPRTSANSGYVRSRPSSTGPRFAMLSNRPIVCSLSPSPANASAY
jgi:hypothetical protein